MIFNIQYQVGQAESPMQMTPQDLKEPPRIVAISGQAQGAIERQLKDVGPVELIRKPLSIQTLSTIV